MVRMTPVCEPVYAAPCRVIGTMGWSIGLPPNHPLFEIVKKCASNSPDCDYATAFCETNPFSAGGTNEWPIWVDHDVRRRATASPREPGEEMVPTRVAPPPPAMRREVHSIVASWYRTIPRRDRPQLPVPETVPVPAPTDPPGPPLPACPHGFTCAG